MKNTIWQERVACEGDGWLHIPALVSGVSNQNGVSLLYIIVEIYQSGRKPLIFSSGKKKF